MAAVAATARPGGRRDFFWLGRGFDMWGSSPLRGAGYEIALGGMFTSPPAAVASTFRQRIDTVDAFAREREAERGPIATNDVAAIGETAPLERHPREGPRGPIVVGETPGFITSHCIDLFGLGADYAMYTKRLLGEFDQHDRKPWFNLRGTFTSAPAAIAWGNRIDVFGVGMDHALYTKRRSGSSWTPEWERLGGAFTSTAALISRGADRLDIFARGADFTMRGNHSNGSGWFGWQNHGGELASEPVAISWGPDRIDVFATFRNGALWHRWWDGQFWNEWESLGGNYVGAPAAVSGQLGEMDVFMCGQDGKLYRHRYFGNSWTNPVVVSLATEKLLAGPPTIVEVTPGLFELFAPTKGGQLRSLRGYADQLAPSSTGFSCRVPGRYRMSVDYIKAETTRAFNADNVGAAITVAVGNALGITKTQWVGEIGGAGSPKTAQTNLLEVKSVIVDLAEPMSFGYLAVNNGHADPDDILDALAKANDSLSLAGSSSMREDIAKGVVKIVSVKISAALAAVPVLGPILKIVSKWLLDELRSIVFKSCDGIVAVEMRAMMGRDLHILTDHGRREYKKVTKHPGTDSPFTCGDESEYHVTWTIKPL